MRIAVIGMLGCLFIGACRKQGVGNSSGGVGVQGDSIEIAGWYNDGWDVESHAAYMANNTLFSEVNPCWYNLGTSDSAPGSAVADGSIYERGYAYNAAEVAAVHAKGDLVIPTLSDMAVGQINSLLKDADARRRLIVNLANVAVTRGYDGWDLDFESGDASGKAGLTDLVNQLADTLSARKRGLRVEVTTGAFQDAAAESEWLFDLAGLAGSRADRIKIMAYDQHLGLDGSPGPVGDIGWVKACLQYMVRQRGVPAGKVLLGIPNYAHVYKRNSIGGYDLQAGFQTWSYIMSITGAVLTFNAVTQESTAGWTTSEGSFMAYYCDAASVGARLDLVDAYGLRGACFWVLGREDPAIYTKLQSIFRGSR